MGQISGPRCSHFRLQPNALGAKQNCSLRERHVIGFTAVATLAGCGVAKYSSRLSPATSSPGSDSSRRRPRAAVVIAPRVDTTRLCVTPNTLAAPSTFLHARYDPKLFSRSPIFTPSPPSGTRATLEPTRRRRQLVQSLKTMATKPLYVPTADAVINCQPPSPSPHHLRIRARYPCG